MALKALVTGGYFDDSGEGVVWEVDFRSGRASEVVRWTPPHHLRVPTKGFAGGSRGWGGALYVAAHACVVRIDPARGSVTGVLHQPCMNDLHHVASIEDCLYVSNTGLGSVDVFDKGGAFLGSHSFLPAWVNGRRLQGEDPADWDAVLKAGWGAEPPQFGSVHPPDDGYHSADRRSAPFHQQKVRDYLHVNHVASDGRRLIATCFYEGSLRDLSGQGIVFQRPGAFLHDGVFHRDSFWMTAIDGTILELDSITLTLRRTLDAFATSHHGWCRGLAVTDDHLLVGLTEVRTGRLPRHKWSDRPPEGSETSILLLDRVDGRLLERVDLTDGVRHSKLYSVIATPEGFR